MEYASYFEYIFSGLMGLAALMGVLAAGNLPEALRTDNLLRIDLVFIEVFLAGCLFCLAAIALKLW